MTTTVEAELPGIFYRRSAPSEPVFKSVGDRIEVGDTLGLIEVMKSFAQVQAPCAGVLTRFLIEEEEAVDAGQALCEIEPAV